MATPGNYNIAAYRNDTLQVVFTFTDSLGAAIDLSSATILLQVRRKADAAVLLSLTEADGLTVSGAGNNVVTLSKLIVLDAGAYMYDLQSTIGAVVTTYVRGLFNVTSDIVL